MRRIVRWGVALGGGLVGGAIVAFLLAGWSVPGSTWGGLLGDRLEECITLARQRFWAFVVAGVVGGAVGAVHDEFEHGTAWFRSLMADWWLGLGTPTIVAWGFVHGIELFQPWRWEAWAVALVAAGILIGSHFPMGWIVHRVSKRWRMLGELMADIEGASGLGGMFVIFSLAVLTAVDVVSALGDPLSPRGSFGEWHWWVIGAMGLTGVCLGFVMTSVVDRSGPTAAMQRDEKSWITVAETAPGFPVLSWSEEVPTGLTQGHVMDRVEFYVMLAMPVIGGLLGALFGGGVGFWVGVVIGVVLMPAAFRRSTVPTLQNVGGYIPMPSAWGKREPTAQEQRSEAMPVTQIDQVQAFIAFAEQEGAADCFVVLVDPASKGSVQCRVMIPWPALMDFSKDMYQRNFASKTRPPVIADTPVIVARWPQGTLLVSETVHGEAELDRQLLPLITHFGPERRDAYYRDKRRRERAARGAQDGSSTIPDEL